MRSKLSQIPIAFKCYRRFMDISLAPDHCKSYLQSTKDSKRSAKRSARDERAAVGSEFVVEGLASLTPDTIF
jgi:hypothetical protein